MSVMIEELWRFGVYKRTQGRIVRQVTFAAIAIALLIGLWQLFFWMKGHTFEPAQSQTPEATAQTPPGWAWAVGIGVPASMAVIGLWGAYRIVNLPTFADFLIAVEAEM